MGNIEQAEVDSLIFGLCIFVPIMGGRFIRWLIKRRK